MNEVDENMIKAIYLLKPAAWLPLSEQNFNIHF